VASIRWQIKVVHVGDLYGKTTEKTNESQIYTKILETVAYDSLQKFEQNDIKK
jgi:hypothetical protein